MNYSVTGSWEKPKIVLVSREKPARPSAAPAAAKGKGAAPPAPPSQAAPAQQDPGLR